MVDLVYGRGITDIVREIPLGVISLTAINLGRYTIYQDINPEALKLYRNKTQVSNIDKKLTSSLVCLG